jgi:site-specific recombinase XerD
MYDPDLSKVRFTGPLAVFAPGWREALVADGYVSCSAAIKLQLAAHLSRWLDEQGLDAGDVTEPVIEDFLVERRATHTHQISLEALGPFLGYLRSLGAIPGLAPHVAVTEQEVLLAEYRDYLLARRGLSAPVVSAYGHWITPFLDHLRAAGCRVRADEVNGNVIAGYLNARLPRLSRKSAKMTTSVLRSFLGFVHASGYSTVSLFEAFPPIVSWRLSGLPQPLNQNETAALLAAADRTTSSGRRDYAVVLLLLRLGLRRQEAAVLQLADLDWAAGNLVVHGKGGRIDTLPLPVDVGAALVDYLQNARPPGLEARELFIRARAPFHGLSPVSISYIVARLAQKAGVGSVFAHRLRHTAASNVLNAGASMEEVAQFLRHASSETSTIYAKTDMTRLSGLARPWPRGGSQS